MKNKMPEGWVKIVWRDGTGIKFTDSVPEVMLHGLKLNINIAGGIVLKIIR